MSEAPSTNPTAIKVDGAENRLHMTWQDGHESTYDGAYLRWMCPCAGCRGHYPGQVPEVSGDLGARIGNLKGGGHPLPAGERAFFEPRFGRGFGHMGARALTARRARRSIRPCLTPRCATFSTGSRALDSSSA